MLRQPPRLCDYLKISYQYKIEVNRYHRRPHIKSATEIVQYHSVVSYRNMHLLEFLICFYNVQFGLYGNNLNSSL